MLDAVERGKLLRSVESVQQNDQPVAQTRRVVAVGSSEALDRCGSERSPHQVDDANLGHTDRC